MPLWVGISWNFYGLGASEQTKVRGNYLCCLVIVVIFWDLEEQRGRGFKVIIRRKEEKPQTRGTFTGAP